LHFTKNNLYVILSLVFNDFCYCWFYFYCCIQR